MDRTIPNKTGLSSLPTIENRISFLYLEYCHISQEDGALIASDKAGSINIPSSAVGALLLGPGTTVTHKAIELAGESGISIVWTGEQGVRYYAGGRSLSSHSRMLIRQAELVSNRKKHLDVVRTMYQMRFPDENVSKLTLQQLRGREGIRVRKLYHDYATQYDVVWNGREYRNGLASDPINQALSAGNVCLYGLAHSVITSIGCSPGLGFVHVGHENSFVYDIADLYKAETTIPLAFEIGSAEGENVSKETRRKLREIFYEKNILKRMVKDIYRLIEPEDNVPEIALWNGAKEAVAAGVAYVNKG